MPGQVYFDQDYYDVVGAYTCLNCGAIQSYMERDGTCITVPVSQKAVPRLLRLPS